MIGSPDQAAAQARFMELRGPLRRFLERYVGHSAVAEELVQDTLLKMHQGWSSYEGRASVKTWAFAIASRVAADHLRSPAARQRIIEIDEVADIADPALSADERLVIDEMNACVRQVIDSLPAPYRAALILHDLEGLSADQTAHISGCSVAAAKIRLHRARRRLKDALGDQCSFYRDTESVLRCDRRATVQG
jgi:RNA polymerase sigma-70 factor (ECF subfamily)